MTAPITASMAVKTQDRATRLRASALRRNRLTMPSVKTFSPAIITVISRISIIRQNTRGLRLSAPVRGSGEDAA